MTAASATITYSGTTVDLNSSTCNNLKIGVRFVNPIFSLSTPLAVGSAIGANVFPINLGMVGNSFDLSFMLHDGPGTFNFASGTTNFEKLEYLANYVKNAKILTLNGTAFYGQIESINIPWEAGKKDLSILGSLTFHCTANIAME
jgi:hypothetical protein